MRPTAGAAGPRDATPGMRGVRAGAIVLIGVVALNLGNYVFHLLSGRVLGPARYGDLATLIALSGLIALPLGGVQVWIARQVAQYVAVGDHEAVHWFVRRALSYMAVGGAGATLILLAASWPIKGVLGVASIAAVALTALTTLPAATSPITWGLAQGLQRFRLVAGIYVAGALSRVGLTLVAFAMGLKVGGAMLATLASMIVALAVPAVALRAWLRPAPASGRRIERRQAAASLAPILVGLLAITALTSVDVVVAKVSLNEETAGIYGSASLIGRIVLYLPAAIVTVLLPRVVARTAGGRESSDILARSVFVTIVFGGAITALYAMAGGLVVRLAFGPAYLEAARLLWIFGIAMTFYAVLNVLLIYDLGRGATGIAWMLGGGALVELALFAQFRESAYQILGVSVATAALLVVAYEAGTRGAVLRAASSALRAVPRSVSSSRRCKTKPDLGYPREGDEGGR